MNYYSLIAFVWATLVMVGGIYVLLWTQDRIGIFLICLGMLYMICAYFFYKYGFKYGNAAFQITLGIGFIGLGISNYMLAISH